MHLKKIYKGKDEQWTFTGRVDKKKVNGAWSCGVKNGTFEMLEMEPS